jgi:ABC-type antimicrobial peptide transport system permease subunit
MALENPPQQKLQNKNKPITIKYFFITSDPPVANRLVMGSTPTLGSSFLLTNQ